MPRAGSCPAPHSPLQAQSPAPCWQTVPWCGGPGGPGGVIPAAPQHPSLEAIGPPSAPNQSQGLRGWVPLPAAGPTGPEAALASSQALGLWEPGPRTRPVPTSGRQLLRVDDLGRILMASAELDTAPDHRESPPGEEMGDRDREESQLISLRAPSTRPRSPSLDRDLSGAGAPARQGPLAPPRGTAGSCETAALASSLDRRPVWGPPLCVLWLSAPNREAQRVLPRATNRASSKQCSRDSSKVSEGGRSIVPVSCAAGGWSPSRLLVRAEAASPTATLGASESGGWRGGTSGGAGGPERNLREPVTAGRPSPEALQATHRH